MEPTFTFKAIVWRWQGKAAWYFLTVPSNLSIQIKGFDKVRRGFGSIPVHANIGSSSWKTSIFPEKKGTYLLPLKASIRKTEKIIEGTNVQVTISLQ